MSTLLLAEWRTQVTRVEKAFDETSKSARAKTCEAMKGLIKHKLNRPVFFYELSSAVNGRITSLAQLLYGAKNGMTLPCYGVMGTRRL